MDRNNQAAGCTNTQTAEQIIFRNNSIQIILRLKALFFQMATWLSIVGGWLC